MTLHPLERVLQYAILAQLPTPRTTPAGFPFALYPADLGRPPRLRRLATWTQTPFATFNTLQSIVLYAFRDSRPPRPRVAPRVATPGG